VYMKMNTKLPGLTMRTATTEVTPLLNRSLAVDGKLTIA
jgi:hypothetical protein